MFSKSDLNFKGEQKSFDEQLKNTHLSEEEH